MNQGSRTGKGTAFMVGRRPEELCPGGDRASVVAKKRGNARGVKGGRKVETLNERTKENSTVNVQWTQFGEEQKQVREPSTLVRTLLGGPPTGEPDAGDLPVRFGGRGKAYLCPYPYRHPKVPSRRVRYDPCRCAHSFD